MPKRIVDLSTLSSLTNDDLLLISDSNDGNRSKKISIGQITNIFGGISSVFGRTGQILAQLGDYTSSLIVNNSDVGGATVTDALNNLISNGPITNLTVLTAGTGWVSPRNGLIEVTVIGAGGGGGGAGNSDSSSNGGGGNCGEFLTAYVEVEAGVTVPYSIGAGGFGGVGFNSGTNGGNTTFGSLQANGGTAGRSGTGGESGPAAGLEVTKNVYVPVFDLQIGAYQPSQGGAAGYSDGTNGVGGRGGNSPYGTGGIAVSTASNGIEGTGYGAGGGGALDGTINRTGGQGSQGAVVVKY